MSVPASKSTPATERHSQNRLKLNTIGRDEILPAMPGISHATHQSPRITSVFPRCFSVVLPLGTVPSRIRKRNRPDFNGHIGSTVYDDRTEELTKGLTNGTTPVVAHAPVEGGIDRR